MVKPLSHRMAQAIEAGFTASLIRLLAESMPNDYDDNDAVYMGVPHGKLSDRRDLPGGGAVNMPDLNVLGAFAPVLHRLEAVHAALEDAASRDLLVRLVAYRLLGSRAVKLPLCTPEYQAIEDHWCAMGTEIDLRAAIDLGDGHEGVPLRVYDLAELGIDLRIITEPAGIVGEFILGSYRCPELGVVPRPGDVVIDGGGCWGDTALHFADDVGPGGRVFSFEFMAENHEIARRSFALNPRVMGRIEIVPNALWDSSDSILPFHANGPGSRVKPGEAVPAADGVRTLSIDDFVERRGLERVDFIKMDIEGAEPAALAGAERTLRRFRPALAICLYHHPHHFAQIPEMLKAFVPEYRFRLGHHSLNQWETVLYAGV